MILDGGDFEMDQPKFNQVASGLLAMNKARADNERSAHLLSRKNSLASHTATVSNDVEFPEDRDIYEMKPQSLFFQDSLIPRPRSDKAIKSLNVDQMFVLDDF